MGDDYIAKLEQRTLAARRVREEEEERRRRVESREQGFNVYFRGANTERPARQPPPPVLSAAGWEGIRPGPGPMRALPRELTSAGTASGESASGPPRRRWDRKQSVVVRGEGGQRVVLQPHQSEAFEDEDEDNDDDDEGSADEETDDSFFEDEDDSEDEDEDEIEEEIEEESDGDSAAESISTEFESESEEDEDEDEEDAADVVLAQAPPPRKVISRPSSAVRQSMPAADAEVQAAIQAMAAENARVMTAEGRPREHAEQAQPPSQQRLSFRAPSRSSAKKPAPTTPSPKRRSPKRRSPKRASPKASPGAVLRQRIQKMDARQQRVMARLLDKIEGVDPEDFEDTQQLQCALLEETMGMDDGAALRTLTMTSDLVFRIESTWGETDWVGLNEIEIFDDAGRIPIREANVAVVGADVTSSQKSNPTRLFSGRPRTTIDRYMWLCPAPSKTGAAAPIDILVSLPEERLDVRHVRIWNFNKSRTESYRGVREMRIFFRGGEVWAGEIEQGMGNQVFDFSTTVQISAAAPPPDASTDESRHWESAKTAAPPPDASTDESRHWESAETIPPSSSEREFARTVAAASHDNGEIDLEALDAADDEFPWKQQEAAAAAAAPVKHRRKTPAGRRREPALAEQHQEQEEEDAEPPPPRNRNPRPRTRMLEGPEIEPPAAEDPEPSPELPPKPALDPLDSLSLFMSTHLGRIDQARLAQALAEDKTPVAESPPATPAPKEAPAPKRPHIPTLPSGRELELRIHSTHGDRFYVGLDGLEVFDGDGRLVTLAAAQIQAEPASINELPEYNNDPRTVDKIADGVYGTCDETHMWLAPFRGGRTNRVRIDLGAPTVVSLVRIWNYNQSRTRAQRGVKDVELVLDGEPIFAGEVRIASGASTDAARHAECILFTRDAALWERIEAAMAAAERAQSAGMGPAPPVAAFSAPVERPPTAGAGDGAPSSLSRSRKQAVVRPEAGGTVVGRRVQIELASNWGDKETVGLAGVRVLDADMEPIAVSGDQLDQSGCGAPVERLVEDDVATTDEERMWEAPLGQAIVTVDLGSEQAIGAILVYNYNGAGDTALRGAQRIFVSVDGQLLSPSEGHLLSPAPGAAHRDLDYGQVVRLRTRSSEGKVERLVAKARALRRNHNDVVLQDYQTLLLPTGHMVRIVIESTWGDPHYVGLNGLEICDAHGNVMSIAGESVSAVPWTDISELRGMEQDPRTLDKLVDGECVTDEDEHMWLAPFAPGEENTIFVRFLQPTAISVLRFFGYTKTPRRSARAVSIYVDHALVFRGELRQASGSARMQSIVFSNDQNILAREREFVHYSGRAGANVEFIDEGNVVVRAKDDPSKVAVPVGGGELERPSTGVVRRGKKR